ncbi:MULTISPECIES: DUF4294 domain-containing protein [Chitinophaga]|uniref:DUF4294 domain-containing protein n=1 Tax=Chitinophaga TaxID=79328 RepID=UPI000DC044C0|nr:DUF4294 domain-containing protein [Chitinophaga ginsengisegetis]MDR6568470.1 hypothetical protein [Chitinophaga ginsengisegetis]MDR6648299.1 hypothetical protein [Chitinophaga ginsengisegetis]MDR6654551.1 hypothetical protein [Chitinophaga ginsengisegetis]
MRIRIKQIIVSLFLALGVSLCYTEAMAQEAHGADVIPLHAMIVGRDTVPVITLAIFDVVAKMPKALRKERERWSRLRNAVYVTYPFARSAAKVLKDVNTRMATMNKRERKAFLASKEKELKAQFGDKLENLSVYQGKVLMKLIDRETGQNCFEIIKELKGGFNARVWQTVAFFFGGNLKSDYDKQEDRDIEVIVQELEMYQQFRAYN